MHSPDPGARRAGAPDRDALLAEVLGGLTASQPSLPCKLFYDERGSGLYEAITRLDAYYPFAAEVALLRAHGEEIGAAVGAGALVVEYGSGNSEKTGLLLDVLDACAGYVPVDISREHLLVAAARIAQSYPDLHVEPLHADFTGALRLPAGLPAHRTVAAFFPGSTIGNFAPDDATALLGNIRALVGRGGSALIGVDIPKDRHTLELAYDDPQGVTARFNLNILDHVNRLFDGDFDTTDFRHEARWDETQCRIEMHLRCLRGHTVHIAGTPVAFRAGQTIWTESSYKYAPDPFRRLADAAGFTPQRTWFDARKRYSMHLLRAPSG